MKRNIFLLLLSCTLSLQGCKDFLEEVPEDRLSEVNFYKTVVDAEAAVNAIYAPIRTGSVFLGPYFQQVEIVTDYMEGRGSTASVGAYQGLDATNIDRTNLLWAGFYQSILYANIAIEKIPNIEGINDNIRNALVAEAKFMRAFCYFHLVKNYGAIPLILSSNQESTGRTPVDEVYTSIINDLKEGEQNLLEQSAVEFGRPTKLGASALLSYVYLTIGKWTEAKASSDIVINSNKFKLIETPAVSDLDKIFGASANGTSEEIFYLKYNSASGWQWPHNLNYINTPFTSFGNYVVYSTLNNKFLNNWSNNDFRKKHGIYTEYVDRFTGQLTQLPEPTRVQFSKFRDTNAPTNTGHANDYTFLRYADILMINAEASCQIEGPTSANMEKVNMIRRRAYGYVTNAISPVDYNHASYNKQQMIDLILQERAYEFFLEGKRWHDLKRYNIVKQTILAAKGITVKDAHLNWPIPQQEINTNPMIDQSDQNTGY